MKDHNMKYMVYLTSHIPIGAYYIGFHSCENPEEFDGYLGSGKGIKELLKLYPLTEFKRETIKIFDNYSEAVQFESDTVVQFINDDLCVNIDKHGGGIFHISKISKEERSEYSKKRIKEHPNSLPDNKGRKHSGAALTNIQNSVKEVHKNSRWITNGIDEAKLLPYQDKSNIPSGWKLGRSDTHMLHTRERIHTEESKQKIKEYNIGVTVWNNGVDTIRLESGKIPPEGYTRGFSGKRKSPSNIGNKQYHNPITGNIIRLMPYDMIPEGYIIGTGKKKN